MRTIPVTPLAATPDSIAPFGTLVLPGEDGTPFGPQDASLDLSQGRPRFYIMRLPHRPLLIRGITRHLRVTQCLASADGADWFIGLARADAPLTADAIACFRIPGGTALALHRGTWHAGPFFVADSQAFFNLELSDTNETDHDTVRIDAQFGVALAIAA
ncbi:ureidoglycolate lyase [Falsiroseomonas sp.]|uniref:ureidoglycolate lyase n=1 Tax=Falsiroseomonas sp. TaxID=2870721 RepID=UPI003F6EF24B